MHPHAHAHSQSYTARQLCNAELQRRFSVLDSSSPQRDRRDSAVHFQAHGHYGEQLQHEYDEYAPHPSSLQHVRSMSTDSMQTYQHQQQHPQHPQFYHQQQQVSAFQYHQQSQQHYQQQHQQPQQQHHNGVQPLHIAFLQASPLLHSESPGRSHALALRSESDLLRDILSESGRAISVRFYCATAANLLRVLTRGTRALHISGHGDPSHLLLENGTGGVEALPQHTLRDMLIAAHSGATGTNNTPHASPTDTNSTLASQGELQFVFISSCFSYRAALAFVEAGCPHVIAVQEDTLVSDKAARAFAAHVYLALCQGRSVREAFGRGRAAVMASTGRAEACCCAHLHATGCSVCPTCRSPLCCSVHSAPCHSEGARSCCSPSLPHDESLKFLLLPAEDAHDVRLFGDVPSGAWTNATPPRPPNNLPAIDHFTGRAADTFAVIQLVLQVSSSICRQMVCADVALSNMCADRIRLLCELVLLVP